MKRASETYLQSRNDRGVTVRIGTGDEAAQVNGGQRDGREQKTRSRLEQGSTAATNSPFGGNRAFGEGNSWQHGKGGQRAPGPVYVGRGSTARVPVAARRRGPSAPAAALAGLAALAVLALLLPALLASRAGDPLPPPDQGAAAATQAPMRPRSAAGAGAALAQQPGAPAPAGIADAPGAIAAAADAAAAEPTVRVYLKRTGQIETLPLEQYVTGVLAAEMPADFELAALKAQAIAARTFIIRRLAAQDTSGVPGGKADVMDTVDHQAYLSASALEKWEKQGKVAELEKLKRAVSETRGIVMTYQGQPITAAFFSASGGYTENSEEYWSLKIPYLRSVSSPWEAKINARNQETVILSIDEVYQKLGQPLPVKSATAQAGSGVSKTSFSKEKASAASFTILSHTTGGRVKEIKVGDRRYSGREFREKLGLRSSQFKIVIDGTEARITTYGYGHGIGMSQWGANGMAKQGYTTTQILRHYYTGIAFQQTEALLE